MEIVTNITDLVEKYDYYFCGDEYWIPPKFEEFKVCEFGKARGFTIGRGKKEYHFITVQPLGFYYGYPLNDRGMLGWRRRIEIGTEITIHFD